MFSQQRIIATFLESCWRERVPSLADVAPIMGLRGALVGCQSLYPEPCFGCLADEIRAFMFCGFALLRCFFTFMDRILVSRSFRYLAH